MCTCSYLQSHNYRVDISKADFKQLYKHLLTEKFTGIAPDTALTSECMTSFSFSVNLLIDAMCSQWAKTGQGN